MVKYRRDDVTWLHILLPLSFHVDPQEVYEYQWDIKRLVLPLLNGFLFGPWKEDRVKWYYFPKGHSEPSPLFQARWFVGRPNILTQFPFLHIGSSTGGWVGGNTFQCTEEISAGCGWTTQYWSASCIFVLHEWEQEADKLTMHDPEYPHEWFKYSNWRVKTWKVPWPGFLRKLGCLPTYSEYRPSILGTHLLAKASLHTIAGHVAHTHFQFEFNIINDMVTVWKFLASGWKKWFIIGM